MCCKGFLKRVFPFFLTFAVGLFIASFFVSVAAPNFKFNRGRKNHREYHRMMESRIQQLEDQNERLQRELSARDALEVNDFNLEVPPPPMPPMPPPAPKVNRGR